MAGERAVSASPVLCFVFSIVTDAFSFFQSNLCFQELFCSFYIICLYAKFSRTNELMYYVTTVAKSPCNTVLITVLPGALFLFRSNYFYRYSILFLSDNNLIQMPDIIYIFLDSSVGCELAAACCVEEPFLAQPFSSLYAASTRFLCVCIGTEVCEDKVAVCSVCVLCVEK